MVKDIKLIFLNKNSENVMNIIIHRLSSELSVCVHEGSSEIKLNVKS